MANVTNPLLNQVGQLSRVNQVNQVNEVITKLQDALDNARDLPGWGVALIVIVTLLCIIILLHVLAIIATGPCLWAMWLRRKRLERDRLLDDDILDPDGVEMAPAAESADGKEASA